MSIQIPGLDTKKALDLYDDDLEMYVFVLRSYITNMPSTIKELKNLSKETLENYVIKAHGIKGTSANIGAEELRQTALKMETLAKSNDLDALQAQNPDFINQIEDLVSNIQKWLDENDV